VHHLHEVPRACGPGVNVAALRPLVAAFPARRPPDRAVSRRERVEDRIEHVDDMLVAADHQAIAALQPPHAAGSSDIDVVDAASRAFPVAADTILVEAV